MKRKAGYATIAALLAASSMGAQDGGPPGLRHGGPGGFGGPGGGFGFHNPRVVTGAPFSADVSNQSSQTLSDGNTISRSTSGHIARDSQGRTYSQETITGGPFGSSQTPVTITFISDPVAGYSYVLNAEKKTAVRRAIKTPPAGAKANGVHPNPPSDPNVVTNDLGTQVINGVNAAGKSRTHTIPAGAMGNSQPVVSTSETWYSPDLQTVVLAKRNDPRFGQSTYSLTNIQRAEPAATLFQVPSDYTVTDAKGPGGPGRGFGGPPPGAPPGGDF